MKRSSKFPWDIIALHWPDSVAAEPACRSYGRRRPLLAGPVAQTSIPPVIPARFPLLV